MDFEAIGKYEVDKEHDMKKIEREREREIKVIVGEGPQIIERKTQLVC